VRGTWTRSSAQGRSPGPAPSHASPTSAAHPPRPSTKIPTSKTAGGWTLQVGDDPTLAGYIALSAANDDRVARAIRINLANGSKLCYYGYCSLNKTPTLTVDQLMACEATVSFLNEAVRYAT
jgi:hypothetical protein